MTKTEQGGKRIGVLLAVLAALLAVMFCPTRLAAQVSGSTLSGTITDESGATVPNAQVTIKNTATGVVRVASTNSDGIYTAPNLQPGDYVVTTSATGFQSLTSNLTLVVGAQQVLNLRLPVGSVSQTVTVNVVAPTVDLADATLGGVNDQTTIVDLPLNGRSWTDLVSLQPGVYAIQTQNPPGSSARWNRGFGEQFTITGTRPQQNNYLLNGISVTDPTNGGPGSVLGGNMGVDAISEFAVLTSNYSAEYGRTSGGVISAVTKPGTNDFHGDAYEFLRNNDLDARNYFDPGSTPPFRRNQFGASAGGPIRKNKTFIFGDYEGLREYLSQSAVQRTPTAAARLGNLVSGTVVPDPQAVRYLNTFYPLPNGNIDGDTGTYSFADPSITGEDYFTVRVDHKISDKDNLNGVFYLDNSSIKAGDEFLNKYAITDVNRKYIALEETHIFNATMLNNFRVGYNRFVDGAPSSYTAVNPAVTDNSFGFLPGTDAGAIMIGGVASFSGGIGGNAKQTDHYNSYQVYDDFQKDVGIHSIRIGGNFERLQNDRYFQPVPEGMFFFTDLASYLTNVPLQTVSFTVPGTPDERQSIWGLYVQDDVRLRRNFTITLGLRWEMPTVPIEIHNRVSNLVNLTDPAVTIGNPLYHNNSYLNFEPRIGFAWDPFKTGKTSVRGGFGVYDQLILMGLLTNPFAAAYPFTVSNNNVNPTPGSFPFTGIPDIINDPLEQHDQHTEVNPPRSYVMEWNLSIQREITPNLTAMIGFVGNHGVNGQVASDDVDIVTPNSTLVPGQYLWPCEPFVPNVGCTGIGSGTRINPNVGRITSTNWYNSSLYDGLQLQVTKRMSHGFQIQGSFTYQKTIDDASGGTNGDVFINGLSSQFQFNHALTRAPADFDTPRVLSINYIWDIPISKSFEGPARVALAGWQLSGIFSASDGQPFTPLLVGDPLGTDSSDPFAYPDRLVGPGCNSYVNPGNVQDYIKLQCFAVPGTVTVNGVQYLRLGTSRRNVLRGPGLQTWDFSVVKNTPLRRISETTVIQFRAEIFNILNRANFQAPIDNEYIMDPSINGYGIVPANPATAIVSGAGAIDQTTTTSRQIQFALKLIW